MLFFELTHWPAGQIDWHAGGCQYDDQNYGIRGHGIFVWHQTASTAARQIGSSTESFSQSNDVRCFKRWLLEWG